MTTMLLVDIICNLALGCTQFFDAGTGMFTFLRLAPNMIRRMAGLAGGVSGGPQMSTWPLA